MATDFFERQASARRSTAWLIGMFAIAVVGIVGATFVAAFLLVSAQQDAVSAITPGAFPWQVPIGAGTGALGLIGLGSLYKVAALRAGGGGGVAEGLGGKRLFPGSVDPDERKLLNVVEEMAIASGTPVPPVFLLEEKGINAFAAGYSPSDAVIGVTRGCVQSLTRDELQGVIAHEFSHILNGDMRMSIRLIGILHGILLLGLIGRIILRTAFHSGSHHGSRRTGSDGSGKGGSGVLVILAIAVALLLIGAIGSFAGGLIKAAVSRQREYLADASAVQFTRNPGGIAGALKRITATAMHGKIGHPRAAELSHMYFSEGVWEGFSSLMATHPPLQKRIRAIEPTWDGTLPEPLKGAEASLELGGQSSGFAGVSTSSEASVAVVSHAVDQVGEPEDAHRRYAAELLEAMPDELMASAREPFGARAVLYALLLDEAPAVRQRQYDDLREMAEPDVVRLMLKILPLADSLEPRLRLPLVDLTLPALAALSLPQYQRFTRSFRALVIADKRLSLFEWVLSQVLLRHLRPKFERVRSPRVQYYALNQLGGPCSVVISALAREADTEAEVPLAFAAAADRLPMVSIQLLSAEECGLDALRKALDQLAFVVARERGRIVDAAAAAICADGHVSTTEAELLRGVSDLLDCPMPLLLPDQTV